MTATIYRVGVPITVPTDRDEIAALVVERTRMVHADRHNFGDRRHSMEECESAWCRQALALLRFVCPNPGHGPGYRPDAFTCPDCGGCWIYEEGGPR